MQFSFNFFSVVLILGAVQGIFLALLLLGKKSNRTAERILALLMVSYSFYISGSAIFGMHLHIKFPVFFDIFYGIPFLFGPLHYLYARFVTFPGQRSSKKQWLHFAPFLISRAYVIPFHFKSAEYKFDFIQSLELYGRPIMMDVLTWAIVIQGIIYMVLTLFLLKRYSLKIKSFFSSIEKINLNWLRTITIMSASVWLLVFFLNLFRTLGYESFEHIDIPISVATTLLIYTMGYFGLRQPEIFSAGSNIKPSGNVNPNGYPTKFNEGISHQGNKNDENLTKYKKSGLSQEKAQKHLQDLLNLMNEERPFTNCNLTLHELAEKLSITAHNLSEIINSQMKKSFFDFVNNYRVEEVKKALTDPDKNHFTFLSIALDAGFSSKSSFNFIFIGIQLSSVMFV